MMVECKALIVEGDGAHMEDSRLEVLRSENRHSVGYMDGSVSLMCLPNHPVNDNCTCMPHISDLSCLRLIGGPCAGLFDHFSFLKKTFLSV